MSGLSIGLDVMATKSCLISLGVDIEHTAGEHELRIHGTSGSFHESDAALDAANSGTTMRLLTGILAAQPFRSTITGDRFLLSRPMGRVVKPLQIMGADVTGRDNDTLPPLVISGGGLRGIEWSLEEPSAQVKSCLILAGLLADGETIIHQPALSRDHTERMLKSMDANLDVSGLTLVVHPRQIKALDVMVPKDISAAAFWLVAASCHPNARLVLPGVGINPGRTGALEVLQLMGARVRQENPRNFGDEPVVDLVVESSNLEGVEIGGELIPRLVDELPVLALAACFAKGTTVIKDAAELRVKESDRIETTVRELSELGASIEARADGMVIHGPVRLKGSLVRSHSDHRLAMALGVAGLVSEGETLVEEAEAAGVSYPEFWDHLQALSKH